MKTEMIVRIIAGVIGAALIVLSIIGARKSKRRILSVIGVAFLIFAVLSWVIPTSTYTSGKLSTKNIDPVGLVQIINSPISALITFALYGAVFAAIGGLYGVMDKTKALEKITNNAVKSFKGKENTFLVITLVLFVLLSSLTGLILPLFVFVPLFAYILLAMGYEKVTALAATVGGLLVGSIGSTLGFNITGYTKNLLSLDMTNQIVARIIILILLTVLFALTLVFTSKKSSKKVEVKKEEVKKEIKKVEVKKTSPKKEVKKTVSKTKSSSKSKAAKTTKAKTTKKSNTKGLAVTKPVKKVSEKSGVSGKGLIIILILMFVFAFVGMYNWYYSFGIDVFNKMHESVMGFEVGGYKIFASLLSGFTQFGYWSNVELIGLIVLTSLIIGLVYKLKFNDLIESFIAGMKEWMPTAIYATLANVVLVVLYQALQGGAGTLVDTINGSLFSMVDGFNPIITGVAAFIGSFFFNDLYYLLANMQAYVSSFGGTDTSIAGLLIQSVYGVAMMVFPTSVVLIAGLSIFDVSYGKWMKFIWRFALIAFLLVLLTAGLLTLV